MAIDSYDPVLNSYLNDFKKNFDLKSLPESELFEFFSAYCVYHRDFSEHTELQDVIVAGGNDTAIDSIGIFINDIPVTSREQVDEVSSKSRFKTDFVFGQSKASKNLSAAEIGSFIQGVREFFSGQYMPANDGISIKRGLSSHIFSLSVKMKEKPRLNLFYCYAGSYKQDAVVAARVEAGKADLAALNMFSEIEFVFLDSNALQERYQEVNLRIEKEIQVNEYASLPVIAGIRQSYIGVLPCCELVKLLSNSDGRLQKSLFNENVRDFLSSNPVNDEIVETIRSSEAQSRLPALNNGITIVARGIMIIGKKFTLSDFQIVNGCQTSHLIFENQSYLRPETSVVVKMVELEDRELINDIVRATNRQTEVKDEAFVVLDEFHKKLERFFASIDATPENKLVYERRKRQYSDTAYTTKNIVTLTFLTNSFVSCILENPVDAVDYYGILLRRYSNRMFRDGHSFWSYLLSATIMREIEKLSVGEVRRSLWKFRFILGVLVRRSFGTVPGLNNDKAQMEYASKALTICHDRAKFVARLTEAERKIAEAIEREGTGFDVLNAHQDRRFVDKLLGRA
ncbi:AIPR family protein [Burkholderia ubonensis]|uniref:AIPR family protein n=1 Tax=Burkholderia ubonensis TaxID=101571 RepID=UPI0009B4071C|nr:AIPR family protein [Burkholderia ubonensis]